MKKIAIIACLLIGCAYSCHPNKPANRIFPGRIESKKTGKAVVAGQPATEKINIHFNNNYCGECHTLPAQAGKNNVKHNGDFKLLCKCHYTFPEKHAHPVDIPPSEEIKPRIPAVFPLKEGKLACNTCHDIAIQCQEDPKAYYKGERFLRETPFSERSRMCFRCHDPLKYRKYNPHKQLNEKGEMLPETCLYCHSELPDVNIVTYKDTKFLVNLELLCIRCHMHSNTQTLHDNHVRRLPSPAVEAKIKETEQEFDIILPLSADGRLTCATCHNPHEEGLIPAERAGAKGASKQYRHRLPGNLCIKCHQMKVLTSG